MSFVLLVAGRQKREVDDVLAPLAQTRDHRLAPGRLQPRKQPVQV